VENGLRLESAEISRVDRKQNLGAGGESVFGLGARFQFGTGGQIGGAAQIRDDLGGVYSPRFPRPDGRGIQNPRAHAAVLAGSSSSGHVCGDGRKKRGTSRADLLLRRERNEFGLRNSRMVLHREVLRLLERKGGWILGVCSKCDHAGKSKEQPKPDEFRHTV